MRATSASIAVLLLASAALTGCTLEGDTMLDPDDAGADAGPPDVGPIDAGPSDAGLECTAGELACHGNVHGTCGEDGESLVDPVECPEACDVELGCVACVPGSRSCDGTVSRVCKDDGSGWIFGRDCGEWDVACGDDGYCADDCASAEKRRSYVGCEYYPVPLPTDWGLELKGFDFRVVVGNPSGAPADITIRRGNQLETRETIAPGAVAEIPLAWIEEESFFLRGGETEWKSHVVEKGAYRLTSSRPVIVTQYNPFHYSRAGYTSNTNDSSLLLPAHVLGTEYVGLSTQAFWGGGSIPGYLAIVGVRPEPTRVTITPTVTVAADATGRWEQTPAGTPFEVTLARGEVANVLPMMPGECNETEPSYSVYRPGYAYCYAEGTDLTGTRIVGDFAVAVYGGHVCTNVPYDIPACDHLETSIAPLDTWGSSFETLPLRDEDTGVPNVVRIVAGHDGTTVTLDPPSDALPADRVLNAGEWVDVTIDGPLSVVGSKPIQVAQIMTGQNVVEPPLERGDPSLTTLVPREQFRDEYVFVAPSSYVPVVNGQSYVLVNRAPGVDVLLDEAPIEAEWTTVNGRELANVPVAGGSHRLESAEPFGALSFGLGWYTSYADPAGMDLVPRPL